MSHSKYSNISTLNAVPNEQLHLQLHVYWSTFYCKSLPLGWFGVQVKNFIENSIQPGRMCKQNAEGEEICEQSECEASRAERRGKRVNEAAWAPLIQQNRASVCVLFLGSYLSFTAPYSFVLIANISPSECECECHSPPLARVYFVSISSTHIAIVQHRAHISLYVCVWCMYMCVSVCALCLRVHLCSTCVFVCVSVSIVCMPPYSRTNVYSKFEFSLWCKPIQISPFPSSLLWLLLFFVIPTTEHVQRDSFSQF